MNRNLLKKIQYLLSNTGRAKSFWPESLTYASHLINRLLSSVIRGKTRMEVRCGKAAQDNDMLRIFGCPAYYHVKEDKLNPCAKKTIFFLFQERCKRLQVVRAQRQEDCGE